MSKEDIVRENFLTTNALVIMRVIGVLSRYHQERVITRYYLTGSLAKGDFAVPPKDIDFAVSLRAGVSYGGGDLQDLLIEIRGISKQTRIWFDITPEAFGHVYEIRETAIVPTGEIRAQEIVGSLPSDESPESRLIDLRLVSSLRNDAAFLVGLYRKIKTFNQRKAASSPVSGQYKEQDLARSEEAAFWNQG